MDYFRIGLFLRPHGIKGELKLLPLTDNLKRFARLSDAFIEAPEGGGPEEYFGWCKNLLDGTIEQRLREAFTVAGYIFFQNCEQAQRQKIFLYSSIPDEQVRPMGMRSFSDMTELLKEAKLDGKSIYVIPNGATVVPHVC